MSPENFAKISDGIFKIFGIFAIVAGGAWAIYEFYDAKNSKKIERSMQYVHSFETKKLNDSIRFISIFWSNYDWKSIPIEKKESEMIRIVYEENEYQDHLKNILNHLDEVAYCIEHEICDEDIVLKSKRGLFVSGYLNHQPWIKEHRKLTGHSTYFSHLECFLTTKYPEFKIQNDICK